MQLKFAFDERQKKELKDSYIIKIWGECVNQWLGNSATNSKLVVWSGKKIGCVLKTKDAKPKGNW